MKDRRQTVRYVTLGVLLGFVPGCGIFVAFLSALLGAKDDSSVLALAMCAVVIVPPLGGLLGLRAGLRAERFQGEAQALPDTAGADVKEKEGEVKQK